LLRQAKHRTDEWIREKQRATSAPFAPALNPRSLKLATTPRQGSSESFLERSDRFLREVI
jgi:hypothetical protein